MSTYDYVLSVFPNFDKAVYTRKAVVAGYTNPVWTNSGDAAKPMRLTVDETVDETALRDDVNAAVAPTLTCDVGVRDIAGNGIATGTIVVTDSRGAAAAGKTINLKPGGGPIVATPGSQVLDGNGSAVFTFGPTWAANVCSGLIPVAFALIDDSAAAVRAAVRFTG